MIDLTKKKLLLFDLDETIYDHRHASLAGLQAIANIYSKWKTHDLMQIESMYFEDLHSSHLKVIDGYFTEEESHIKRFQKIASFHQLQFKDDEYIHMVNLYNQFSKLSKRAIPKAPEVIDTLKQKGFTLGLITNGKKENQTNKIKLCGIQDYLDFTLISEEIGMRKPSREIFEKAMALGQAKPTETVMIGDSWDSDIIGAVKAQIQPIWVNRGRHHNHNPQTVIEIKHIEELIR